MCWRIVKTNGFFANNTIGKTSIDQPPIIFDRPSNVLLNNLDCTKNWFFEQLSTSWRSNLRVGRLTSQLWNRHQIQDMVNSACFGRISDFRYLISDIWCLPGTFVYSDVWDIWDLKFCLVIHCFWSISVSQNYKFSWPGISHSCSAGSFSAQPNKQPPCSF